MTDFNDLTTSQLNQIIAIKEQIQVLRGQIDSVVNYGGEIPVPLAETKHPKKRRMSAAGRAKIAAAARARWAKAKAAGKMAL